MKKKCFYIIAGEKSGDHYASQLVKSLIKLHPDSTFFGFGGVEMQNSGVSISRSLDFLEIIGFTEVVEKLPEILKNFTIAKRDIKELKPDALILIDYPGFNLRMAKWAKGRGMKVFYYISPQTWAWKRGRNKQLKNYTDKVYSILPFEEEFLRNDGVRAEYVGHPMLDDVRKVKNLNQENIINDNVEISGQTKILLMPGSRISELKRLAPILNQLILKFPDKQFTIAAISSIEPKYYAEFEQHRNVKLAYDQALKLMDEADVGLIKSGTSTLQAALINLPQLVFYRVSPLSAWIMRKLAKVEFVSLPNLIMNEEIVKELLQEEFNIENLVKELKKLEIPAERERIKNKYNLIRNKLTLEGLPPLKVANSILKNIDHQT